MSHDTTATAHAHTESWKPYAAVLAALLFLTMVTVGAAYINLGSANVVIALGIATIKAVLVALFFMHLLHDKPINAVIAVAGFLFLGLMLTFCLLDIDTREDNRPGTLKEAPKVAAPVVAAPAAEHAEHK
jgi:cytochrome c oxidase subunit IV